MIGPQRSLFYTTVLLPGEFSKDGSQLPAERLEQHLHKTGIAIRQCKYLNNIVEQDHRAVKRQVKPMLGFKSFWAAQCTIAGIEVMHATRKGQLAASTREECLTSAEQFYSLAT